MEIPYSIWNVYRHHHTLLICWPEDFSHFCIEKVSVFHYTENLMNFDDCHHPTETEQTKKKKKSEFSGVSNAGLCNTKNGISKHLPCQVGRSPDHLSCMSNQSQFVPKHGFDGHACNSICCMYTQCFTANDWEHNNW